MVEMLWISTGGFLGAIIRYAFVSFVSVRWPGKLPLGTLLVNLLGSLLLGWIAGRGMDEQAVLFLGTGFSGAFTTFSSFKMENIHLFWRGEGKISLLYIGLSYVIGIGAAWIGFRTGL